jgi:hypothetical protein
MTVAIPKRLLLSYYVFSILICFMYFCVSFCLYKEIKRAEGIIDITISSHLGSNISECVALCLQESWCDSDNILLSYPDFNCFYPSPLKPKCVIYVRRFPTLNAYIFYIADNSCYSTIYSPPSFYSL